MGGGGGDGIFTTINGSQAYVTSSLAIGGATAPDHQVSVSGSVSASVNISASAFYGDGSNLSGITTSPAGATTQLQYNSAGAFAGSTNLTFNGTTLTGSYTGSLAELTTLSASAANLSVVSGTQAGPGSYLSLDENNNVVLSPGDGATTSPGGATTQIQFNNASAFGGSANLTFNGTTLTGSYTGSVAELTTLSASLVNVEPLSGTMAGPGSYLSLDTNNNVVLASGDGATTSPAGANTQIQFNNSGDFGASANLTYDGSTITVKGASHLSGGVVHRHTTVSTVYTASVTDYILGVSAVPTEIEVDATLFSEGQVLVIKDESGAASVSSTISLAPSASQTIDGASAVTIESPYGSVLLYSNGSNWFIY